MRIFRILTIAAATTVAVGLAVPAAAAPTDTTVVTFDVAAGTLDIVAPVGADVGDGDSGDVITGVLGSIAVDDGRAAADASWEVEAISSDFTTGAGTPAETIPAAAVDYWSGPATATTGNGTFAPGQATAPDAEPLDNVTPVIAFNHTGGTGNNTAAWNPTLNVDVPLANVTGTYTGTVTHSVA